MTTFTNLLILTKSLNLEVKVFSNTFMVLEGIILKTLEVLGEIEAILEA